MTETIPHILACDVGNSGIRFAHVQGEKVGDPRGFRQGELAGMGGSLWRLWQEMPEPRKVVACSVNAAGLKALEAAAQDTLGEEVLIVGRDLPLPMATDLPEPQRVGTDRICCAVAAYDRLGQACIVADFGTAITIDCVSDAGAFLGGAILPGLNMGAKALNADTSQLPRISLKLPDDVFGKSTEQAILIGLILGARGALREIVESYSRELERWPEVIVTGGDAKLICPHVGHSELVQAVVPDLVFRGVAMAYYGTLTG